MSKNSVSNEVDINSAWGNFCDGIIDDTEVTEPVNICDPPTPKCSDIYISTKTKILFKSTSRFGKRVLETSCIMLS